MMKHPVKITKDWCINMAKIEGDAEIGAGVPSAMDIMTTEAFASEFKPTIWHRLGFGHAHVAPWGENEDDAGWALRGGVGDEGGEQGLAKTPANTNPPIEGDGK